MTNPVSWAKHLDPMMGLLGQMEMPEATETDSATGRSLAVSTPVSMPRTCLEAMTTSSSGAHPALGPIPIAVTLANLAPALTAATVFAVAMPKSLRVMISTSMPEICLSILMRSLQVKGSSTPMLSA